MQTTEGPEPLIGMAVEPRSAADRQKLDLALSELLQHDLCFAPSEEQQREIEALTAEGNAVIDEHGEEPKDEAVYDRLLTLQDHIAALAEGEEQRFSFT